MQVTVISRRYCAELTVEEFQAVAALNKVHEKKGAAVLWEMMGAVGAQYDGHFGTSIYFTLPDDLQDQFANIILLINSYITVAKEKGYIECH